MIYTLTAAQAISTVQRLLADPKFGPDHTAECSYGTAENPICIVGHIFAEHIPEIFEEPAILSNPCVWDLVGRGILGTETTDLSEALDVTQSHQDWGYCWGAAAQNILALKEEA